jgi:DNA uptake protein ComE-like DNA-binding protein
MEKNEKELHSSATRSADIDTAFFDLNSASEQDIRAIEDLTPELVRAICDHRPFQSMEDVRRVPGMTEDMMDVLLRAGATVGDARPA